MIIPATNGAELLCKSLESLGVRHVFGIPGTQSVMLYDALQRSNIRSVLSTHELGACFMANGYYRASGKIAPLVTIPGPGFTYALTGLAEALHDSAALLHIVGLPAGKSGKKFVFQALDQEVVAGPLVKGVFSLREAEQIPRLAGEAFRLAASGEPGPVLLQWSREALSSSPTIPVGNFTSGKIEEPVHDDLLLEEAAKLLGGARRPLLMAGQGAASAAALVKRFAESIASPVFTTSSGRGVLPEDHALALGFDLNRGAVHDLNEMIRKSDCIMVLGCKLTHPGTGNFQLELPPDRLIHVDASREVLGANYPARLAIHGSVEDVLRRLLRTVRRSADSLEEGWKPDEIEGWKKRFRGIPAGTVVLEPVVQGVSPATAGAFFAALRRALPRDGIVVTDSGLHQGLVRRHFDILSPRGLIMPSDLQSMGFGLPAAIGAKLAAPERPVVAVIGDGGFAMSGMELLTAVRERSR